MIQKFYKNLVFLGLVGITAPAFAGHGSLSSNARDAWIDESVQDLADSGLIPGLPRPAKDLTNLEVAQLTVKAGETLLAQADLGALPPLPGDALPGLPSPPGGGGLPALGLPARGLKSVQQLVEEYKRDMEALGVNPTQYVERIYELERENERLAELQSKYLTRTGTDVSGYGRSYLGSFRGFTDVNRLYPERIYDSIWSMEMRLKSVPVPFLLFDVRLRLVQEIGAPSFANPLTPSLAADFRWISLTSYGEYASVTAGDFMKHYTPLTLWNYEVPIFNFIEPTPYQIMRKDAEEWEFMDHGPDFRLRGVQVSTSVAWPTSPILSYFQAQAMAGPLVNKTTFWDYFAGSQASLSFFRDNLEFKGTGLFLGNEINTSKDKLAGIKPTDPTTWPRQYQIGSVSARTTIPFAPDMSLTGSCEYVGNYFNDDLSNSATLAQGVYRDWAARATGGLNILGAHLNAKYLNTGPWFYSPGAQTTRFTPLGSPRLGPPAYPVVLGTPVDTGNGMYNITNGGGLDENVIGTLNRFPFQTALPPFFTGYDRMTENMLPYGDATPNRQALIVGFSADIGSNGWIKPQGSYTVQANEIQQNYALNNAAIAGAVTVDGAPNTRTYGGYEGALTIDLAKLWVLKDKACQVSADYKHQTTDLGLSDPFVVNTLIASVDFNVPFEDFKDLVLSGGYEQAQSSGSEYVLAKGGNPGTLAYYPFYRDIKINRAVFGAYNYSAINLVKNSWAAAFKYPINKVITVRGVWIENYYTGSLIPSSGGGITSYDRQDQIWRFEFEAGF